MTGPCFCWPAAQAKLTRSKTCFRFGTSSPHSMEYFEYLRIDIEKDCHNNGRLSVIFRFTVSAQLLSLNP